MRTATRLIALVLSLSVTIACDRPTPVAPSESTLTVTANPTRIAVNGTATITVLARKADGRAVNPGTEINFSTDLGSIDTIAVTDTRGIAEATLTGDGRIGIATVSVESGAAASTSLEIQVGALASSISLTATPRTINKDLPPGGEKIKLTAEVFDDLNNPIRNVSVIFDADVGTFQEGGSVTTNLNGRAKNVLLLTEVRNVTDGFFDISVRTKGDGDAEISQFVSIDVVGFAFDITLTATPTSVPVTGGTVRLSALVIDDFGDPAAGDNVNFTTTLGTLASGGGLLQTDEGGLALDTLTITEADLASLAGTTITVTAAVFTSGDEPIVTAEATVSLQTEEPIAGFDFNVTGLTVNFTNTSTGAAPLTYLWDFGDGGTSTSENPGNTYAAEGTYSVSLTATNIGGASTITKEVIVQAAPSISVSPTTLNFGSVKNPGTADRIVTVSNSGDTDLAITGLSSSNPAFSVITGLPGAIGPGGSANITLRFSPAVVAANTSETGTLTVTSDDPNNPTVAVSLSGIALP